MDHDGKDMDKVVLKYLEYNGHATFDDLFKECDIYDWTWSVVDMESLLSDMSFEKQVKSYAVYVNDIYSIHIYVAYNTSVELVQMNVVK